MRGSPGGLGTPHPIVGTLPGLLAADPFVERMCAGLDDILAPVFATLDSFPAYLDPATVPEDMLAWLAGWIGLALEAGESAERCRELLIEGVEQMGRLGTARGVAAAVRTVFGVEPEVTETGEAAWSAKAGAAMPGLPGAKLLVRLRVADASTIDLVRLDALVAAVKPAHVVHRIEVEGDPVPEEPPAPPPVARRNPVPQARTWAPSVVFAPGTPVVSFLLHEEEGGNGVVAVHPAEGAEDGLAGAAASGSAPSEITPSEITPSESPPAGSGPSVDVPSDDTAPLGEAPLGEAPFGEAPDGEGPG